MILFTSEGRGRGRGGVHPRPFGQGPVKMIQLPPGWAFHLDYNGLVLSKPTHSWGQSAEISQRMEFLLCALQEMSAAQVVVKIASALQNKMKTKINVCAPSPTPLSLSENEPHRASRNSLPPWSSSLGSQAAVQVGAGSSQESCLEVEGMQQLLAPVS